MLENGGSHDTGSATAYTRSVLIGLTRLWRRKSYENGQVVFFSDIVSCYWLLSIVITCEWPSPKRWNLCTNRTTINLSLWQYSLLLSRFFFKKSCHPLLFFSFFVEHRLLLFTRKLLCFSKPSRFQLFGMQIIHMLLFLVWISMDV